MVKVEAVIRFGRATHAPLARPVRVTSAEKPGQHVESLDSKPLLEPTDGFWYPGHDRKAETALLDIVYGDGTTADPLARLGYGPDNSIITSRDGLRAERSGQHYVSASALFDAAKNAGYEVRRGSMQVMLFHSERKVGGWNTKDSHWYVSKVIASNHREAMERYGFRWMEKAVGRHCWWQIDGEHSAGKFHAVVTALTGVSFRR